MSKADEMLNKLGLRRNLDNEDTLIYRYKDDYWDRILHFDKKMKRFNYRTDIFIAKDEETWREMVKNNEFRNDFDKHCSRYGYWGNLSYDIDMELLQAINEKVKELGWI